MEFDGRLMILSMGMGAMMAQTASRKAALLVVCEAMVLVMNRVVFDCLQCCNADGKKKN